MRKFLRMGGREGFVYHNHAIVVVGWFIRFVGKFPLPTSTKSFSTSSSKPYYPFLLLPL